MPMNRILILAAAALAMGLCAAPASAAPAPPGCQIDPIFGLHPQGREICDAPIQPDGSWTRERQFSTLESVKSSCGGQYYEAGYCPPWLTHDVVPASQSPVDTYIVTPDTIPDGEPGHIDS